MRSAKEKQERRSLAGRLSRRARSKTSATPVQIALEPAATQVRAYLYDGEGADGEVELNEALVRHLSDHQLLWVDIQGMQRSDLTPFAKMFDWHNDSIYNLLQSRRRPRLDYFSSYAQASIDAIHDEDKSYRVATLHFIVGKNYVITAHEQEIALLKSFATRIRDDSDLGHLSSTELFVSLLDWHLTDYFRVVDRMELDVDRMDEFALRSRASDALLEEMVEMRRRISRVRRALTPHREVFSALSRPEFMQIASGESAQHFRDLNDRLERAIDAVENARELLIGSFDIYMTQTTRKTNEVVKTLTLFSVPFFVGSVVTGLMGMNFKVPLYEAGTAGFLGVLAFIAITSGAMLTVARWKRWI